MKDIINVIVVICAILILVSCEDKDEVADEIVDYYNEGWISIHNMKQKKMKGIVDDLVEYEEANKTDEAANLYENEITPLADEVLERHQSLDPANKKIKKMNDMQIETSEYFKETSKDVVTYYNGGDVSESDLKEQNNKLEKKRGEVLEYRDVLMEEYDLEEVEDNTGNARFSRIERAEE